MTENSDDNKYAEYSSDKVKSYKESWDQDLFKGVDLIDLGEIVFIILGLLTFVCLSFVYKVVFIITLILFYWFRIKWIERKIIKAKQFYILGAEFINENFRGRGVTEGGAKPHYSAHERGFDEYIGFLETQRNHLVARMVILNLFALVLLGIIK